MTTRRVAIQGGHGAYHGIAAERFFAGDEVQLVPCSTFRDIFEELNKEPSTIGIMAIENTIAGSLLPNYELLRLHKYPIVGEYKLRISHCLAALPGQSIHDIREIQSHPIALMQCVEFTDKLLNVRLVEHEDTALAARDVATRQQMGCGVICSERAANLYGLQVLARGIETNKHNFTRFLLFGGEWLADEMHERNEVNKSSIVFSLPHSEGSLAKVLSVLSYYNVNLTKIQSLPIIGQEWEYLFYVDIKFSDIERYHLSLQAIKPLTSALRILGIYADGVQDESVIN